MNGRIYDPLLGRFLSADTFVQDAGDLQAYNRYSYVATNPLTSTDRSGFSIDHPNDNDLLRKSKATTPEALAVLQNVNSGPTVYRQGNFDVQITADAQFWATDNQARFSATQ